MVFDFKKEYKEYYMPKNKPTIVTIPKMNYIAVRGKGNPNEENGAYQNAVGVIYAIAYTLKMSYKTDYKIDGFYEYVVPFGGKIMLRVLTIPIKTNLIGFQ